MGKTTNTLSDKNIKRTEKKKRKKVKKERWKGKERRREKSCNSTELKKEKKK